MKSKRIFMCVIGVMVCAVSVGFFKLAAFGVDPFQSFMSGADQLITLQSAKNLETLYVFEETQLLGRSHPWPKGAMTARNISHQHAQLTVSGGVCTVTDLGSVNGTYLNGQRLAANTPAALTPGDRIVMGDETLIYNCIRLQKEEQA